MVLFLKFVRLELWKITFYTHTELNETKRIRHTQFYNGFLIANTRSFGTEKHQVFSIQWRSNNINRPEWNTFNMNICYVI